MGGVFDPSGREMCIQGFFFAISGVKRLLRRPKLRLEDNTKIDLHEVGRDLDWTVFVSR